MNFSIIIFSSLNQYAQELIKNLHHQYFKIYLVTSDTNWPSVLAQESLDSVQIIPLQNLPEIKARYAVTIQLRQEDQTLSQSRSTLSSPEIKSTLILSAFPKDQPSLPKELVKNTKLIYVALPNFTQKLLEEAVAKQTIIAPNPSTILYFTSPVAAADVISREIFSFTNPQPTLLCSQISSQNFVTKLKEQIPHLKINHATNITAPQLPKTNFLTRQLPFPDQYFTHTLKSATPHPSSRKTKKSFILASLVFMWTLALPFVLLFISATSSFAAYKSALAGKASVTQFFFQTAHTSANLAKSGFLILSNTPFLGKNFQSASTSADILAKLALIGQKAFDLVTHTNLLAHHILAEDPYDLETLANNIYLDLDSLYKQSSFLEGDFKGVNSSILSLLPHSQNIKKYRQYIYAGRELSQNLEALLGLDQPATYLVLMQNNMELRPTGGFIGSFALITFESGKLINTEVYDVYSADGQIKGYIKPPSPISEHLGEESWFFRDSNWDPDFATSARRAEWFLDKTLDRTVNGVIAIDLEVVRELLKITGPLILADYNDEIDHKNLYEKLQHEVQSEFFPGSRKKANYLTAISQSLISKLQDLKSREVLRSATSLVHALDSRDIQLYFHDPTITQIASVLGWSGEVLPPECQDNCESIWTGIVEANLGVNKSNYFIHREAALKINLASHSIENTLIIKLKNSATDLDRTPELRYKNYLRILAPKNSSFNRTTIQDSSQTVSSMPDVNYFANRAEAGLLLDLLPNQEKILIFNWTTPTNLNFSQPGSLQFNWRKQAGVPPHSIEVQFTFPSGTALTKQTPPRYNTVLSEDYNFQINW